LFKVASKLKDSFADAAWRLPVGSSAKIKSGSVTIALSDGDSLLLTS
jgi:hypothetical protein